MLFRHALVLSAVAGSLLLVSTGCSSRRHNASGLQPPALSAAKFSAPTAVTNQYHPLVPGTTQVMLVEHGSERETLVVEVLSTTRTVQGIACVVVRDRAFEGGLLLEDTLDFYAQDDAGNVWYLGEEVDNYAYDADDNVIAITHEGAWEAGKDVAGRGVLAQPGFVMPASPRVGDKYLQEFYRGEAEDTGEIVALAVPVTLADGTTHQCLQVRDASQLTTGSELKYYARGIGKVREEAEGGTAAGNLLGTFRPGVGSAPNFAAAAFSAATTLTHAFAPFAADTTEIYFGAGDEGDETILVERLPGTRVVAGVTCVRVRDRVFRDGLLIEDTEDWYAQDDAGNVWYMGEQVDNHEYDDDGNLVATDHDGSWEAGIDTAGTGTTAQPGYYLPADPQRGDSYHQEFYPGEATDMGNVLATDVEIELADGRVFTGCVQTLDWNPLDPDGVEFKFFAPGLGLVFEDVLHDGERLDHVGTFRQGAANVPDFAAATFLQSTTIDHPFFPLPIGGTWSYEKPSDEGLEATTVTVQAASRIVMGIACIEALYEKTVDGLVHEVARDWYAQDDAGNVWYMGEAVDNYHYDEQGTLLSITHEGSWEAGLDTDGTGQPAKPGFQLPATPVVGQSYFQEYYATAAEDMGFVVATGVTLEVGDRTFPGCLQTLDWNPLEPDAIEYKFYAPGIGLVLEHHVGDEDELGELVDSTLL
jgi:hypothetical protein